MIAPTYILYRCCVEGWCCFDKRSCDERWSRAEYLMSSKEWPQTRIGNNFVQK